MEKSHQWPQFLAVFCAGFLSIGSGIQLAWPSPSIPKLVSGELGFDVSQEAASYIVMLYPLAYIIGSPLSGMLMDRIGRKYTLLSLAPIQITSWIAIIFANTVGYLYAARILMGIADGGLYTSLPAYIGEVMEPHVRGTASMGHTLGILVGTFLVNIYGSFTTIKMSACISLLAPILFLTTFIWMPESPYYLLAKNYDDKARKGLQILRKLENVDNELESIKKAVQQQMTEPGSFKDIYKVSWNLKAFLILVVLRTLQHLSGIFAIAFYMQTIFELADSAVSPQISAIICNAIRIPLTFTALLMTDKFGRKIMIQTSGVGTTLCLTVLATYFYLQLNGYDMSYVTWLPLTTMIIYYVFCSMGLLVVPNIMMSELLANNIKAKVLAIQNIYFGLSMGVFSKLFHWTESSFGAHVPFYLFAVSCALGVIFIYFFVPETKDRTLNEIQQILKGSKDKERKESNREVYTITLAV